MTLQLARLTGVDNPTGVIRSEGVAEREGQPFGCKVARYVAQMTAAGPVEEEEIW